MNLKKILMIILLPFMLLACGSNKSNDDNVLRVGMEVGYVPFNWFQNTDKNGAVKIANGYANGYDVQIAKLIAEKLHKKLEVVQYQWDALLGPALNSNKIDLVIAGVSPTNERKNSLDFTKPYYKSDIVVITRKGEYENAKSINDFKGARITGQLNTIHYDLINQMKGVKKEAPMDNFPVMLVALKSKRIDGYIAEKPTALSIIHTNKDITYHQFTKGNGFNYNHDEIDVAIAVKKGNKKLLEEVEKALSTISEQTREKLMQQAIEDQPTLQ